MNDKQINKIFEFMHNNLSTFKVNKYLKDESRKIFNERIKNATSNIHLFGLNFPNYITNPKNKIWNALKDLDFCNEHIDIYIYIPSLKIRSFIDELNIYEEEYKPRNLRRDLYKIIDDHKKNFKNLNINIIEYDKLYKIGLSAIDINTQNAFIHLSQVKENELIKDAEYFNIEYNDDSKSTIKMIDTLLKRVRDAN